MISQNKKRFHLALMNAAEFIRSHVETGLEPEDVGEDDEKGLSEYHKACQKIADKITKLADKYNI